MAEATCSVEGCPRKVFATIYCSPHYQRLRNTGDVQADKPIQQRGATNPDGICRADGCNAAARTRRYCPKHRQPITLFCTAPGCMQITKARDLCAAHLTRIQRFGELMLDKPVRAKPLHKLGDPCTASGCKSPVKIVSRGLCSKHDARKRSAELRKDPAKLEAQRAYQRAFKAAEYAKDPQLHNQRKKDYKKAWDARNPEKAKAKRARNNHRRRVTMNNAPHIPFTASQLADRMRYWGNRCWMCHGPEDAIDHVKPVSRQGYHALSNLRPICITCNTHKGAKWPFPTSTINPPKVPLRLAKAGLAQAA